MGIVRALRALPIPVGSPRALPGAEGVPAPFLMRVGRHLERRGNGDRPRRTNSRKPFQMPRISFVRFPGSALPFAFEPNGPDQNPRLLQHGADDVFHPAHPPSPHLSRHRLPPRDGAAVSREPAGRQRRSGAHGSALPDLARERVRPRRQWREAPRGQHAFRRVGHRSGVRHERPRRRCPRDGARAATRRNGDRLLRSLEARIPRENPHRSGLRQAADDRLDQVQSGADQQQGRLSLQRPRGRDLRGEGRRRHVRRRV